MNPCKKCDRDEGCATMCPKWREWFLAAWSETRERFGAEPLDPPRKKAAAIYVYEARDWRTGELVARGSADEIGARLGISRSTLHRWCAGNVEKARYRVTRLETGAADET